MIPSVATVSSPVAFKNTVELRVLKRHCDAPTTEAGGVRGQRGEGRGKAACKLRVRLSQKQSRKEDTSQDAPDEPA